MKTSFILILSLLTVGCTDTTKEDLQSFLQNSVSLDGGTWKTSCLIIDGTYQKYTASFSGSTYSETTTVYSDLCVTPQMEIRESGTYSVAGSPNTYATIDRSVSALSMTARTATMAQSFNSVSYCGVSSWAAGSAVDLINKSCDGQAMPTMGQYYYDIYFIESVAGNNPGALHFGNRGGINDGLTVAKRPTSFLVQPAFYKQY